MGAKVGNIGGGMVELFSWSDSSTTSRNSARFVLTNEEIQKLKEYAKQYSFFAYRVEAQVNGSDMRYRAYSAVCIAETIYNAITNYDNGYFDAQVDTGTTNGSVRFTCYTSGKYFDVKATDSNYPNMVINFKIYGIK